MADNIIIPEEYQSGKTYFYLTQVYPKFVAKMDRVWQQLKSVQEEGDSDPKRGLRLLNTESAIVQAQQVLDLVWYWIDNNLNYHTAWDNIRTTTDSGLSHKANPDILRRIPNVIYFGDYKIIYNAKIDNELFYDSNGGKQSLVFWDKWNKNRSEIYGGYFPAIVTLQICKRDDNMLLIGTNVVIDSDKITYKNIALDDKFISKSEAMAFLYQTGFNHLSGSTTDQQLNPRINFTATCFPVIPEDDPVGGGGGTILTVDDCPCEEILVEKTVYLRKTRMSDKDVPIIIKSKREICKQKFTGKKYKFKCDEDLFKEIKSGGGTPGGGGNVPVPQTFSFPNNIGSLGSLQSVGRRRR